MSILFFDTETTGLKQDGFPATDPIQPMPVQLGMKLDSENRRELGAVNFLVKADGWDINPGASAIHGIDKDTTMKYGIHLITSIELFLDFVAPAETIVAHNIAFDAVVMQRATFVYHEIMGTQYVNPFEDRKMICTMLAAMDTVKAKPKRYGQWKWPKLSECIKFWYNEELDGAHDALVDVRACARIFYEMRKEGTIS